MSRTRLLVAATALALGSCSEAAAPPEPSATRPVKSAPEPPREVPSVFDEDPPSPSAAGSASAPTIAPRDASPEAQRAAAIAALRGDTDPQQVPVEATESGVPLRPALRNQLASDMVPRSPAQQLRPSIRMGATQVTGRLPREVIQRIVHQNFGRYRLCYETALRLDPRQEGSVLVTFVIGTDGSVKSATERGSTVKDTVMRACVVKAFTTLSFPSPEGGSVAVTYPIHFTPPDA